jgi:uncharacterized protein YidB (DUF937 family)
LWLRWPAKQEANMGLLDILTGMQNGPRGRSQPSSASSGGMSPLMMALLGLLAYKAFKGSGQPAPASPPRTGSGGLGDILGGMLGGGRPSGMPSGIPSGTPSTGSGGLGDNLGGLLGGGRPGGIPSGTPSMGSGSGGLGSLLGGGSAGSVLSGGLDNLVKQMQDNGYGKQARSWVGTGENEGIAPDDLAKALGRDTIDTLTHETGMDRDELLSGLSQHLPNLVDQLTPEGRLPTEEEASTMV